MTVSEWLHTAELQLFEVGVEDARLEARVLAGAALRVERPWLIAHCDDEVDVEACEELLARRLYREPLAYIVGFREFYGRSFKVTPAVLIPRQETEALVTAALDLLPREASVLDVGTGSGCIGLTLALERPTLEVTLSDVSPAALGIAQENARRLGAKVKFVESNLFAAFRAGELFDLILSNPPYIAEAVPLMPEVGLFEPEVALYGGESGFEFYEYFAEYGSDRLTEQGRVLLECGDGQSSDVTDLFQSEGWNVAGNWKDLLGIARAVAFTR